MPDLLLRLWKKVGENDAVRLADIVEGDVVAEGMTINAYEMNGNTIEYTNTSTTGVLTCAQPYQYVDRFEVELVKGTKVYATLSIPIIAEQQGSQGLPGCHERVFEVFTAGQTYYNEENTVKNGIRYIDFLALEDNTVQSGYKVYMCTETHVAASTFANDSSYWSEVNVNAASAFFTYLIAKNANIKILASAQFTIAEANGTVVAGLINDTIPLWIGASLPSNAPFRVTRAGKLYATGAEISGKITATQGTIGPFTIGSEGLYCGNITNMATSKNDFVYIHSSSVKIGQQVGYFTAGDIANLKVFIGRNADPTVSDNDAYCNTALYIYRNMTTSNKALMYHPAVRVESDNSANRNIAMRLQGGLQVWGGLIEKGYRLEYTQSGDTNVLDLSFGTTFILGTTLSSEPQFFIPTLTEIRRQLGVGTTDAFAVPIKIIARKGSSNFRVSSQINASTPASDAEGGKFVDNNGNAGWEDSDVTMGKGDVIEFILCYTSTTGYYIQLINIRN